MCFSYCTTFTIMLFPYCMMYCRHASGLMQGGRASSSSSPSSFNFSTYIFSTTVPVPVHLTVQTSLCQKNGTPDQEMPAGHRQRCLSWTRARVEKEIQERSKNDPSAPATKEEQATWRGYRTARWNPSRSVLARLFPASRPLSSGSTVPAAAANIKGFKGFFQHNVGGVWRQGGPGARAVLPRQQALMSLS